MKFGLKSKPSFLGSFEISLPLARNTIHNPANHPLGLVETVFQVAPNVVDKRFLLRWHPNNSIPSNDPILRFGLGLMSEEIVLF